MKPVLIWLRCLTLGLMIAVCASCRAPEDSLPSTSGSGQGSGSTASADTSQPAQPQNPQGQPPAPVQGSLATEPGPESAKAQPLAIADPTAPRIVVAEKRIDFGDQPQKRELNKALNIRNDGKSELQITSVQPSCGCTAVDYPKSLAPGKSGKIKVKMDTGSAPGPHTKTVTIMSNDPAQPSVVVDLVVNVKENK
jgi:hypothetical protein